MCAKCLSLSLMVMGTLWAGAWANEAPRAHIAVLFAEPAALVEVTLAAMDPDGDPLEFELLDVPTMGALLGTPPHLTYCPAPGFSGSARISFLVRDPHGAFDVGWVEIRINSDVQSLRVVPKLPTNPVLQGVIGFLATQGVKTWYIADVEPRNFPLGVWPFLFAGGADQARVFLMGPAEAPVLQELGKLQDGVLPVDMRQARPGLYFFLVVSGENAFSYPVRLVQPVPNHVLAHAG